MFFYDLNRLCLIAFVILLDYIFRLLCRSTQFVLFDLIYIFINAVLTGLARQLELYF